MNRALRYVVLVLVLALTASACGDDDDTASPETAESTTTTTTPATTPESETTTTAALVGDAAEGAEDAQNVLHVPADFDTIQAAVDAAQPGDLVLIEEGTYNEAVIVQTDDIVIRGVDRNTVILDGQHAEDKQNGFIVFSNGVAIENLTATGYQSNGIFFTGDYDADIILTGYRASYITTYNNGDYGIYAFNAQGGLIENSYGSGHPDSGFYIGQCQPCDAVVRNVLSEHNALGYSGTNSGGNLYVVESEFRNNRVGIVPNSLDSEELAPQRDAVFAGNYVHDNGNENTPRKGAEWDLAFGVGIVIAGGTDNLVTKNLVTNNPYAGIGVSLFVDQNIWSAERNTVRDNVVSGSPSDLFLLVADPTAGASGNCFEGNTFTTSVPEDLETQAPCDGTGAALTGVGAPNAGTYAVADYQTMPVPPAQESMPDAATAPAVPARATPPPVDVDALSVPTGDS